MNEQQLTTFFAGLDARLKGFHEMKAAFDERVAFDFNMLEFFNPGETKISEILAFFLNPNETHGQNTAFLRQFLRYFELSEAQYLLDEGASVKVKCEDRIEDDRRIDITIVFGNRQYAVGIENKIGAADQPNQVRDYCTSLRKETNNNNYILLYLTKDRHEPSGLSLGEGNRERSEEKPRYKCVSYEEDILALLGQYEKLCRADDVRSFIRQLQQYTKRKILNLGEKAMSDQVILEKYVNDHPEIIEHTDGLKFAVDALREKFLERVWKAVKESVKTLNIKANGWEGSCYWVVVTPRSEATKGNLLWRICYEPNDKSHPLYLCVGKVPKEREARFEEGIRARIIEVRHGNKFWKAILNLPNLFSNDSICKFIQDRSDQDRSDSALKTAAADVGAKVEKYFETVEAVWQQISQAAP